MWEHDCCFKNKDHTDTRGQRIGWQSSPTLTAYHEDSESDGQSDEDDDGRDKQLLYGIRMRAADPRYLTTDDDANRGDILLTMEQVKKVITVKLRSEEEVATIWLTTSEMGFSLMDEPNTVVCTKDVKEGKVCDRYLAPAISKFVTNTLTKTNIGTETGQQTSDIWRELVSLHRRWGKVNKRTEGDNLRSQARRDADATRLHKNRSTQESPVGERFHCEDSI